MQALQNGMMAIIPAYVAGDWHQIKEIALKMKQSYIFQQQLTAEQKKNFITTYQPPSSNKISKETTLE